LAGLDHPGIVPVYDVAHTEDGQCYVVSKFVEGMDLRSRIKQGRPGLTECVELVARVAEALHYAHQHSLVHRDIKPSNILLDIRGNPFVADFGLALREEDFGKGPVDAGTPIYMSPEQARGEGHLVDARTDVYSLGLVFYELLTGQRPFRAKSRSELLDQINTQEVRPPRQLNDSIPKELDRVCLKALSKRVSDRYSTALDLAEDLRHWQAGQVEKPATSLQVLIPPAVNITPSSTPAAPGPPESSLKVGSISDRLSVRVIPKGLRSFDAEDADYFLELLPGPRGRDGLPDSIRFWKSRLEETNSDKTFRVGLIYGPSGCGKSSFVKAGLLPRLAEHVRTVYVEATPDDTEGRLLKGLAKQFSGLPTKSGLAEVLTCLRKGQHLAASKVLIVLDQFEQWLHAMQDEQNPELIQALRQCDGQHLQCVLLVRDDFWMAITSFMKELEVPLLENQNSAAVDLFSPRHARRVLLAFGQAFDAVAASVTTSEQERFLDQAVAGLAENGKVIPVRLALFAEMVKGRPWTTSTLKEVGGAEGIGVAFLEETFSASTAPPQHRFHQKAARAVLQALLPEPGASWKGQMKSHQELLHASGYSLKPKEFDELLHILDTELRLVTPSPGDESVSGDSAEDGRSTGKYYQLTHDYLVPSLQQWLVRKQQETFRGRAELRLAERSGLWSSRPKNRHLPAWWEWVNILACTRPSTWTAPERRMMQNATWYHTLRTCGLLVLLAVAGLVAWQVNGSLQAEAMVGKLRSAELTEVPKIIKDLEPYRRWADPRLHQMKAGGNSKERLYAGLALAPVDPGQVDYLGECLLNARPEEVPVIRDALAAHKDQLHDQLWAVVEAPEKGKESQRLRAAAALAKYDPDSEKWVKAQKDVGNDLVGVPAVHLSLWMDSLHPVRTRLLPQLSAVYRDPKRRETERSLAADILADYAADQPELLADLLMDADDKQFAVIFPKIREQGERCLGFLTGEIDRNLRPDEKDEAKEKLAKRQANAAVALLRMNQPAKVWPLLKHGPPDPRVRSYLIHRLGPMGADANTLVKRLAEEPDVTIRRALILSLGPEEFAEPTWRAEEKNELVQQLQDIYRTDDDPGLHAAAEWLLRQWQQDQWLRQTNEEWAKDKELREKRLDLIKQELTKQKDETPPQWYVNSQGQTLVVIPGSVTFMMGSPEAEGGGKRHEIQHKMQIGRTFALAAKPVTVEQYRKFHARYGINEIEQWAPTADSPVVRITWFQAAAYCNWLSMQEGLPPSEWCYEPIADPKAVTTLTTLAGSSVGLLAGSLRPLAATCGLVPGQAAPEYKGGMRMAPNYLQRTGYRLPTEAEMEYATRARAATSRYFGETEDLLEKYAWYVKNCQERTWPVGMKKPNDLGLFDAHGNVFSWCQEEFEDYPKDRGERANEDKERSLVINAQVYRVLRGGSFKLVASDVRCAARSSSEPTGTAANISFRPARTFMP
jgi:formylglycine-generating enzyme required for sulfatase activity